MKKLILTTILALTISNAALAHGGEAAGAEQAETIIKTIPVSQDIFMLEGEGGNIGVLRASDKIIIIDSQFYHLSEKLESAISAISTKPIAFLLNTHFHYDHTDGNEGFATDGATIIAQENVRSKLKEGATIAAFGKVMEPAPAAALPVITFKNVLNIYADDEELDLQHYANAHTNTDSVIYFKTANVIHAGDIYFNGMFPFIDRSNGGSVEGYIKAMQTILARADSKTKIIPGHGPLGSKATMQKDLDMLIAISSFVVKQKNLGKSATEIAKMDLVQNYGKEYGNGFLSIDKFVEIIY